MAVMLMLMLLMMMMMLMLNVNIGLGVDVNVVEDDGVDVDVDCWLLLLMIKWGWLWLWWVMMSPDDGWQFFRLASFDLTHVSCKICRLILLTEYCQLAAVSCHTSPAKHIDSQQILRVWCFELEDLIFWFASISMSVLNSFHIPQSDRQAALTRLLALDLLCWLAVTCRPTCDNWLKLLSRFSAFVWYVS